MNKSEQQEEFSLKNYFIPFTSAKAVHFIILIGLVIFCNGIFNGFVADDDSQIVQNANIHTIANIVSFFTGGTFFNGGAQLLGVYYKPLMVTIFAIIYSLFGPNASLFHFVQIIIFIANACLLFFVLNHFFRKSIAFMLSVIFLVHPITSEVAFYISDMQDVLFFFFGILSLFFLIRLKSDKFLFVVPLFFLLSLFSKETGILFILVGVLYKILFDKKRFLSFFGGTVLSILIYAFLRAVSIGIFIKPSASPIDNLTLLQRFINIPASMWFYLKTFLFPLDLSVLHDWVYTKVTFTNFILPLIFDLIFLVGTLSIGIFIFIKSRKSFTIYLFFTLWFLLGLLFHLQIFPLDTTVAERWFYFPVVGLLGMIGVLLSLHKNLLNNKLIFLIIISIVTLLSIRTFIRSFDWRDNMTLYTHDLTVFPNSFGMQNELGYELLQQGQYTEAMVHIKKSVALYPHFTNYNNLGMAYVGLGDYKNAKKSYQKALQFGDYYLIYENLAGLSLVYGNSKENIVFIQNALKKYPQDSKLWLYLAVLEYQNNNSSDAKYAVTKAYTYDQSVEVASTYYKIMNKLPLNLNVKKRPNS